MDRRKLTITPTEGALVTDDKGRRIDGPTEVIWGMRYARLEHAGSITVDRQPRPAKRPTKKSKD